MLDSDLIYFRTATILEPLAMALPFAVQLLILHEFNMGELCLGSRKDWGIPSFPAFTGAITFKFV